MAMLGNMTASLISHKKIVTTLAKAKYARKFAERMITFARKGGLSARRHVASLVNDKTAVKALFDQLGPHFKHRNGGYTRIIKLGPRHGDAAEMALLELVGFDDIAVAPAAEDTRKESKSRLKGAQKKATSAKKAAAPAKSKAPAKEAAPADNSEEK
jgi:large subunit ribosomal protein L17